MIPRIVGASSIMEVLYAFGMNTPRIQRTYPATAAAISAASSEDPIFPNHEAGGAATACLLLALARRRTGFWPYDTYPGRCMGLYRLRCPEPIDGRSIDGRMLMLPHHASFVATDQIRRSLTAHQSVARKRKVDWSAGLAGFLIENDRVPLRQAIRESRVILELTMRILTRHMPPANREDLPGFLLEGAAS